MALRRMAILAYSTFQNVRGEFVPPPTSCLLLEISLKNHPRIIDRGDGIAVSNSCLMAMRGRIISIGKKLHCWLFLMAKILQLDESQPSKHLRDTAKQAFSFRAHNLIPMPGLKLSSCLYCGVRHLLRNGRQGSRPLPEKETLKRWR